MRIGYPCINRTIGCKGDQKFRLQSFSEPRLIETVQNNLDCLEKMLKFNIARQMHFFRITSDLVPFASHPVCKVNWQHHFRKQLAEIGNFIKQHAIRISMHPGQFTILNSPNPKVVRNAIRELGYHVEILELLELDRTARIQIHVGGVYADKNESIRRFVQQFKQLDSEIQNRLAIENDEKSYSLADCLEIFQDCGVPIIFDAFHHALKNSKESLAKAFELFVPIWNEESGIPMVDYSSQQPGKPFGKHCDSIDLADFSAFVQQTRGHDFDLMLEIKDKEISALKAVQFLKNDARLYQPKQEEQ